MNQLNGYRNGYEKKENIANANKLSNITKFILSGFCKYARINRNIISTTMARPTRPCSIKIR